MPDATPDVMNILARIEILDNQVRTLRRMGIYLLIIIAALFLVLTIGIIRVQGQSGPLKEVALRDENGKQRLWLGIVQGSPGLEFYDENQKVIGGLKMTANERGLLLFDENHQQRAMLGIANGQPGLILYDENGKPTADLSDSKSGTALFLKNEQGRPRAGLIVEKDRPEHNSGLIVFDDQGRQRATVSVTKEVTGMVLGDERSKPRAGMSLGEKGPHLFLKDEKDKDLFSEPH